MRYPKNGNQNQNNSNVVKALSKISGVRFVEQGKETYYADVKRGETFTLSYNGLKNCCTKARKRKSA